MCSFIPLTDNFSWSFHEVSTSSLISWCSGKLYLVFPTCPKKWFHSYPWCTTSFFLGYSEQLSYEHPIFTDVKSLINSRLVLPETYVPLSHIKKDIRYFSVSDYNNSFTNCTYSNMKSFSLELQYTSSLTPLSTTNPSLLSSFFRPLYNVPRPIIS